MFGWVRHIGKVIAFPFVVAMISSQVGCRGHLEVGPGEGQVKVHDIDVAYRVLGEGQPLVMIMGYGSTKNLWEDRLLRQLATRFKVITFDNRGLGASSSGTHAFSIEQFADDTAGLMAALGVSKAHVLGWSMGAMIAQELALRHPERVNRLVLYAGHSDARLFPPAPDVIQRLTDPSGTPQERGMRFISVLFPGSWLRDHGARVKEVFFRPMGNIPQETLDRQSQAIDTWKGSTERLGSIRQPTLLIAGAKDVLVVPRNALDMKGRIPGAQLALMDDGGHGLMFQDPAWFSGTLLDFLK